MPTTYLAPGVYVEEVPSLQQPIAGVGTNTVGFIGVVPDDIQVAVPNENYDPTIAKALAGGATATAAEVQRLEAEVRALEERRNNSQRALDEATAKLGTDLAAPERTRTERERDRSTRELAQIAREIERLNRDIKKITNPQTVADAVRPYRLERVQIDVEPGDAKLCTNFTEYVARFGTFSADDPNAAPGTALHAGHRALTHAVYGFFNNGGTRCFVARVRTDNAAEIDRALTEFESIDAIAIVAAPGLTGTDVWNRLVTHCELMEDRFAILDSAAAVESPDGDLDITLLNYDTANNLLPGRSKNAAFYFPHVHVIDPSKQLQDQDPVRNIPLKARGRVCVPPSGHIAGLYARVDVQRGVHKAPANEVLRGAVEVKYYIGKPKQELLNPQGVNCIRNLNGNIIVYGARTVGGDRNAEWKYVNVRRTFLYIKESIDEGTQWAVFEPNDEKLWGKLKLNVGAFLTNVWRSGALFGSTADQAFFVKCDAENNPVEVRELGQVVIEVGVAIVRPAEFVIFRITQWAGPRTS
jgi:phage tail sheath protein FI